MTHTHDIISSLIIFSVILAPKYHTRIKGPSALGHTHQASFRIGLHTSSVFPHWVSYIRRLSALRHASSVFPHSDTRIRRLSAFGQTVISADKGQVAQRTTCTCTTCTLVQSQVSIHCTYIRSLSDFTWSIQNSVFTIYFTFTVLSYGI